MKKKDILKVAAVLRSIRPTDPHGRAADLWDKAVTDTLMIVTKRRPNYDCMTFVRATGALEPLK